MRYLNSLAKVVQDRANLCDGNDDVDNADKMPDNNHVDEAGPKAPAKLPFCTFAKGRAKYLPRYKGQFKHGPPGNTVLKSTTYYSNIFEAFVAVREMRSKLGLETKVPTIEQIGEAVACDGHRDPRGSQYYFGAGDSEVPPYGSVGRVHRESARANIT